MASDPPPLLRPIPRRPFDLNFNLVSPSTTSPPSPEQKPTHLEVSSSGTDTPSFSRTRSILNLTSSTLFGIYSPTSFSGEREDSTTSWGSETPRETVHVEGREKAPFATRTHSSLHKRTRSASHVAQTPLPNYLFKLVSRILLLFALGMGYGLLVTHLHDDRHLAAVRVEGFMKPRYNWSYLCFWGVAGVGLGSLLPYIDTLFPSSTAIPDPNSTTRRARDGTPEKDDSAVVEEGLAADWNPVVRSIGAFVGIAFAIRKLPWTSPLQMSATLALVNPVLWYLVDRSKPGFLLSSSVGLVGTTILLSLNPEIMPAPQTRLSSQLFASGNVTSATGSEALGWLVSKETLECGTWIISVLFCSCVCFGNIGRRLALPGVGKVRRDSFR